MKKNPQRKYTVISKRTIVNKAAKLYGIDNMIAYRLYTIFLEVIKDEIINSKGNAIIWLTPLGSLYIHEVQAHTRFIGLIGRDIEMLPSKRLKFRAGKRLKQELKKMMEERYNAGELDYLEKDPNQVRQHMEKN